MLNLLNPASLNFGVLIRILNFSSVECSSALSLLSRIWHARDLAVIALATDKYAANV